MQFGGMFWQICKGFNYASSFNQLFEKEEVTLGEVLDDDSVIQEFKNQNQKLIDL
jgi:hypothetical protein